MTLGICRLLLAVLFAGLGASVAQAQTFQHGAMTNGSGGGNITAAANTTFFTYHRYQDSPPIFACEYLFATEYDDTYLVPTAVCRADICGADWGAGSRNPTGFTFPVGPGTNRCPSCDRTLHAVIQDVSDADPYQPLENTAFFSPFNPTAELRITWQTKSAFTPGTATRIKMVGGVETTYASGTCSYQLTPQINTSSSDDVMIYAPAPADDDGDGIVNSSDNCQHKANPLQLDSDLDGCGNTCDGDFDQSGFTDNSDFLIFGQNNNLPVPPALATTDMDGSGFVDLKDFLLFGQQNNTPPGPSGTTAQCWP